MYLITNKGNSKILGMDSALDYISNGYPRLINLDIAFVKEDVNVYEVSEVPSEVMPEKYCYTELEGFYINPNWVEPDPTNTYGIPDETYHAIIDDYTAELFGGEA